MSRRGWQFGWAPKTISPGITTGFENAGAQLRSLHHPSRNLLRCAQKVSTAPAREGQTRNGRLWRPPTDRYHIGDVTVGQCGENVLVVCADPMITPRWLS